MVAVLIMKSNRSEHRLEIGYLDFHTKQCESFAGLVDLSYTYYKLVCKVIIFLTFRGYAQNGVGTHVLAKDVNKQFEVQFSFMAL